MGLFRTKVIFPEKENFQIKSDATRWQTLKQDKKKEKNENDNETCLRCIHEYTTKNSFK